MATAWPLTSALSRPEFGYVRHPLSITSLPDFTPRSVDALDARQAQVFILFARMWQPEWSWTNFEIVRKVWRHFYGYEPELSLVEMRQRPVTPVASWSRHGLWIEVYEMLPNMHPKSPERAKPLNDRLACCWDGSEIY